jgi:uroporphyrinogen decarboxylase
VGGYLKTKEQIEKWFGEYGWPHELKIKPFDANSYNEFKANFGNKFYPGLGVGGSGIYEKVVFMMGQDRFGYIARKDPEFLLKVIKSIGDYQLNILKEYKKDRLKPEFFWTADDMGQKGRSLLSPEMFRKFFFNIRKEVFDTMHDMGAKVVMHSCGNITDLLPTLIELKLDAWQSLEPASDIDFKFVKEKYGDKMVFIGGLDSSRELCFGTKKSVKDHVKKQIETLGKNGGYVAGPAHDFLNQKLDLVLTMRDAIYEFGKYK